MEKGTRLSGIFDYPEAAKSHDSRIIGTRLYNTSDKPLQNVNLPMVTKVLKAPHPHRHPQGAEFMPFRKEAIKRLHLEHATLKLITQ